MLKLSKYFALLLVAFLFQSWGFFGHKKINRMAVFTLPPDMVGFYKRNISYIENHAVDPDKRRYVSEGEAPRHYIDIDHYAKDGADPFEIMPEKWTAAVEKFTEDTLQAYGIVPWHINRTLVWLIKAFEAKDAERILSISAELGHYIADAHVPLHTTENYNGQLTGQKGIHGLWESRIPELLADDFNFLVGRAHYIDNPLKEVWDAIKESHQYLDSVLLIEKDISRSIPVDRKYAIESRGVTNSKQYSQEYALAYQQRMGNMVETRMQKAILMIGSMWYTAWVNAGQPALMEMNSVDINKQDTLRKYFQLGKMLGREHEH